MLVLLPLIEIKLKQPMAFINFNKNLQIFFCINKTHLFTTLLQLS